MPSFLPNVSLLYSFPIRKYSVFVEDISRLVRWETTYNAALVAQLAGSLTGEAMISQQAFPFVTQPHFEITGGFVDGTYDNDIT